MSRLRTFSAVVAVLTVASLGAVILLESRADAGRRAQVRVGSLKLALADLTSAPFGADRGAQGPSAPARARTAIGADETVLSRGLVADSGIASRRSAATMRLMLAHIAVTVGRVYDISARASGVNGSAEIPALQRTLSEQTAVLSARLAQAGRADARGARHARLEATVGTAVVMLALLAGFLYFYRRSDLARRENARLLDISRQEARTDSLTGLGNRRALEEDLAAMDPFHDSSPEALLAIFDLNGFKQYNDSFGHSAGDALLTRLGGRLAHAVRLSGSAYRMGGDEFCLLARCDPVVAGQLLADAASALTEQGEGWSIGCSRGAARMPAEARTASEALRTADGRMYQDKARRARASDDFADLTG